MGAYVASQQEAGQSAGAALGRRLGRRPRTGRTEGQRAERFVRALRSGETAGPRWPLRGPRTCLQWRWQMSDARTADRSGSEGVRRRLVSRQARYARAGGRDRADGDERRRVRAARDDATRAGDNFREWYERIINTFFDEVHTIKELQVTPAGDHADVKVVVNWQAKVWQPPDGEEQVARVRRLPDMGAAALARRRGRRRSSATSSTTSCRCPARPIWANTAGRTHRRAGGPPRGEIA